MSDDKLPLPSEGECKIDLFHKREIRKVMHQGEWWFSVKDVLESLTDTTDGNRYSRDLREKDSGLKTRWAEITLTLNFDTGAGGKQNMTFINIEGIFRLIQSVPSKKAEPFKKWIARVGFERLQEIENPELAIQRAITLYRAKGYDDSWIDARIRNKASREALTAEWDKRDMNEYIGILTDAISVETFGIATKDHKQLKGLTTQNLRDNMTPIELTLTTLGEQATSEIIKAVNPITLDDNKRVAKRGGHVAGVAREQIEQETGQKVISPQNYLTARQRENNALKNSEFDRIMQKLLDLPKKI
jgi:hypothetical protein